MGLGFGRRMHAADALMQGAASASCIAIDNANEFDSHLHISYTGAL